jgi:hypothetical protein
MDITTPIRACEQLPVDGVVGLIQQDGLKKVKIQVKG